MRSFYVKGNNNKYVNQNIYKALKSAYPTLSQGNLNKVFRLKDVKVNHVRVTKDYVLQYNDFVEIYLTDDILFGKPTDIKVIYDDPNILIAFKPARIPSCNQTHKYDENDIYFEKIIMDKFGESIKICHRLDTNTEGLVIFSKNDLAHTEILDSFKSHLTEKKYIAFVYGTPPKRSDKIKAYLLKDNSTSTVKIYNNPVKYSEEIITEYTVLDHISPHNVSILEVTLHTGKTHQIRAHLSFIGHPIIGDPKYSSNEINKKFKLSYQALVAYSYKFNFPKNSVLYYLNSKPIKLDKQEIIKKIAEKL